MSRIVLIVLVAAMVVAGCGDDSAPQEPSAAGNATATSTAAAPDAAALAGTWLRTLTRKDLKAANASLDGPPEGLPVGRLKLIIEPDGAVFAVFPDGGDEEAAFEATGDRVKVTGNACGDPAASATYRWERSGESLTLIPIDNDCPERQAVLDGTWRPG